MTLRTLAYSSVSFCHLLPPHQESARRLIYSLIKLDTRATWADCRVSVSRPSPVDTPRDQRPANTQLAWHGVQVEHLQNNSSLAITTAGRLGGEVRCGEVDLSPKTCSKSSSYYQAKWVVVRISSGAMIFSSQWIITRPLIDGSHCHISHLAYSPTPGPRAPPPFILRGWCIEVTSTFEQEFKP